MEISHSNEIGSKPITFSRSLQPIKKIGQGACGETVLLHDNDIKEYFVCKKYKPYDDSYKEKLFSSFIREIKLLHLVYHKNIVRVFSYYLYPKSLTGYILMEYIDGKDIFNYLKYNPSNINDIFTQVIKGFLYLEENKILHRDIRKENILVTDEGTVKIIDFGFGKIINNNADFKKTFTLNPWCDEPEEYKEKVYTGESEVYFVGKLFEKCIEENSIETFEYSHILKQMCTYSSKSRAGSFSDILKLTQQQDMPSKFNNQQMKWYRNFSYCLDNIIATIGFEPQYEKNLDKIKASLLGLYNNVMLEENIPDNQLIIQCFINARYKYYTELFPVKVLGDFINLLESCSKEQQETILNNLQHKLNPKREKYDYSDVPF